MKKIGIFILLFVTGLVSAQQVEFKASAPSVVATGEQFRLSYTLNKEGTDLRIPDLKGFDKLMGPRVSQSTSFSMINGKTTQSASYTYTYILEGVKEGVYQIAPATVMVDGRQYTSNALKIEVVKGTSGNSGSDRRGENRAVQRDASAAINENNLFVKVLFNITIYK